MNTKTDDITARAIESIVRQWRGGEHIMAGKRASQLVYAGKKPDDALLERVKAEVPGIERYISAPESPVTTVTDQGGDPLTHQPENDTSQIDPSNTSSDAARKEQDEIDARLKDGRERAEKAGKSDGDTTGTTKLNPAGSSKPSKAPGKRGAK
ncbi:hypothetical protein FJ955_03015 [Mesorhizobium sp. B2-2-2]|uniref:hypothetical protein n=1 Tax=Mesorhizobium sp. B2-2-2 TaxID=2589964 RepID=UPI00112AD1B3|nr:hypothetical protein [Mesorhizobium sp. B2-2-2]TPM33727.1 hypothetical protein FJ955_03015 [Mesorhizobium sp. B2-2-2]